MKDPIMPQDWWIAEVKRILKAIAKLEPPTAIINEMGWCPYCVKKQDENHECCCL